MIWRICERQLRCTARSIIRALRSAALHFIHPWVRPRGKQMPGGIKTILAIRLDRLGDLVLTLPALDDLAAAWPHAKLIVAVRPNLAPLLHGRRSISQVVEIPAEMKISELSEKMKIIDADLGISFAGVDEMLTVRSMARAGIPLRMGFVGGGREVYLTHAVQPPRKTRSLLEENGLLVSAVGAANSRRSPVISLSPAEYDEAEQFLATMGARCGQPRIALHPGGFYPSQRWSPKNFAEAASSIIRDRGGQIFVLIGPGEASLGEQIYAHLDGDCIVLPDLEIRKLASVLSRCDLLVANNSGPLHLAGAVGIPTISVMGPTDPSRFWPQGKFQTVIRRDHLSCSPCSRGQCASHECLKAITPCEVSRGALELLDPLRVAGQMVEEEAERCASVDLTKAPHGNRKGLRLVGGDKWIEEQEELISEAKDELQRTR